MPTLGNQNEVGVRISTKADNSGIDKAESRLSSFAKTAQAGALGVIGGFTALAGAAAAAGLGAIKMAADMEQSQIAFTTLLDDADKAKSFLSDLFQFAAETPFEIKGLQDASRKLLAFGFESKEIIPMMTDIGDAVAALGGGEFEIDRVTRALGQMRAKGKVSAEEMMQLAELGIPVWELLADKIGTDIPTAMDLASKGAISGMDGINAILEGMNKKFGGSMKAQSETINGLFSTLKDNVAMMAIDVGNELIDAFNIKELMKSAIPLIKSFGDTIKNNIIPFLKENTGLIKIWAGVIGGMLVAAFIALAPAIWAAVAPVLAFMAPFLAIGAALTLLYFAFQNNWWGIRDIVMGVVTYFTDTVIPALQGFWDWMKEKLSWLKNNWAEAIGYIIGFFVTLPIKLPMYMAMAVGKIIEYLKSVDWAKVWEVLKTAFSTTMASLHNLAVALWDRIKAIDWGQLFKDAGKGIANGLLGLIEGAIKGALAGVPGAGKISLPRFADGVTNFGGGLAVVGERGPELVRLPRGSDVIPNHKIGGMTVNQTNNIYNQIDMDAALGQLGFMLRS